MWGASLNYSPPMSKIKQSSPRFWFNRYNKGSKYTRVYLPAQEPKVDDSGEVTVDLLDNLWDTQPTAGATRLIGNTKNRSRSQTCVCIF